LYDILLLFLEEKMDLRLSRVLLIITQEELYKRPSTSYLKDELKWTRKLYHRLSTRLFAGKGERIYDRFMLPMFL
jgi:hypothetical protein